MLIILAILFVTVVESTIRIKNIFNILKLRDNLLIYLNIRILNKILYNYNNLINQIYIEILNYYYLFIFVYTILYKILII